MDASTNSRIVELEITLAHHGKTIEEMSEVIAGQWNEIEKIRKKLDALTSRFLALEETAAPTIEATKPPHW